MPENRTDETQARVSFQKDRLRFLPFPEAGHGVTEAMWKEAQEWIVRGLGKSPQGAKSR